VDCVCPRSRRPLEVSCSLSLGTFGGRATSRTPGARQTYLSGFEQHLTDTSTIPIVIAENPIADRWKGRETAPAFPGVWPAFCSRRIADSCECVRVIEKGIVMPRPSKPQPTTPTGPRLVKKRAPQLPISTEVTHEQIAIRAYELFEQDGFVHGHHVDHWLTAEQELRNVPALQRPKRAAAARPRS
jgi:hypothetical protein